MPLSYPRDRPPTSAAFHQSPSGSTYPALEIVKCIERELVIIDEHLGIAADDLTGVTGTTETIQTEFEL